MPINQNQNQNQNNANTPAPVQGNEQQGAQAAAPNKGIPGITPRAYNIYSGWGSKKPKKAQNGAIGGSALLAGLSSNKSIGPAAQAAVINSAALSKTIKGDNPKRKAARQYTRKFLSENGVLDENMQLTLADGTKADVGSDDRAYAKGMSDREGAAKYGAAAYEALSAYAADYTNDATLLSIMGGVSLTRLLTGTTSIAAEQLGSQIANGCVSNIDTKGDLTREKFNKLITNYRSVYANAGIKSKSEAYTLANQLYAEGRVDDTELFQMHNTFNMIYDDDSWEYAQTVLSGKMAGAQLANEKKRARRIKRKR